MSELLDAAGGALAELVQPSTMLWLLVGIAVGILVGLIPGMSGVVGLSVMLPFVLAMEPGSAIVVMVALAAVFHTSDTFPSVLLGIPGSSGSQATIMDGYPLAKMGLAKQALGAAFTASMFGGVLGAVLLLVSLLLVRPVVLSLGSPHLFMLAVLGLSVVGVLVKGSAVAGVAAGFGGLLLGTIGAAPNAAEFRFTFDTIYLYDGLPIASMALGLFAIPELMDLLIQKRSVAKHNQLGGRLLEGLKDTLRNFGSVVRSSILGTTVGVIPGIGGTVVDWMAYSLGRQTARRDNHFGKGDIRGVIAPESANNAKEAGALVPTLLFGIPGGGTTAILLSALIGLGLQPGPRMVSDNLDTTLLIVWTFIVASILVAGICFMLTGPIARITLIPAPRLAPFLLILVTLSAFQFSRHWGDIVAVVVVGIFGWGMKHLNWPRPPLLVGFVLADPAERFLFISIERHGASWLADPVVIGLGVVTALIVIGALSGGRVSGRVRRYVSKRQDLGSGE